MSDDGAYLRFPHLHRDLLCFTAEDDLWVAPLPPEGEGGSRAWRLTADRTRIGPPRFSPDGAQIAYTTWHSLDPEIHLAPVDGGPVRRLTYWGSTDARVCGWMPPAPDEDPAQPHILAVSSHGQPFSYFSWAYKLATDGSQGGRLPWGPVADIAVADLDGERRTLLLTGRPPHEPASWKRYRGGACGRLWLHGERLIPRPAAGGPEAELNGHLEAPMFVAGRIAFLSDHEGVGNLYSCLPDGSDLRRHTDHAEFYARHASTDGQRVTYQCAGELWLVEDLSPTGTPRRLDIRLGGPRTGRRRYQVSAADHVDSLAVDTTGRASAVCVRGSLYWLTHRDGPARTLVDTPGVRVRMPEMLGATGQIAYVTDAGGEDSIEIAHLPRATGAQPPRRLAAGQLGRVHEVVSSPDGRTLAVATHDGRLLLIATGAGPAEQKPDTETSSDTAQEKDGKDKKQAKSREGTKGTEGTGGTTSAEDAPEPSAAGSGGADAPESGTETADPTAPRLPETPGRPEDPAEPGEPVHPPSGADPLGPGTPREGEGEPPTGGGAATSAATSRAAGTVRMTLPRAARNAPRPSGRSGAPSGADDAGDPTAPPDGADPEASPTTTSGKKAKKAGKDGKGGKDGKQGKKGKSGKSARKAGDTAKSARKARRAGGSGDAGGTEGEVVELVRSSNGPVRDLAFSPDSRWLAWAHPGIGRSLSQIKLARLHGERTILEVTDARFEDEEPVFTRDGRYLAFLSWRGFDPVYDVHTGDLSFPLGCRPYLVPLSSATPSPFALTPEGRTAAGGLDPEALGEAAAEEGTVLVEAEGLASRVTPFPVAASKYSSLYPVSGGGLVWLRWPLSGALGETFANPNDTSGQPTLEHFDLAKAKSTELRDELDWFAVSGDGSRLVVYDEGDLNVVPATTTADSDTTVELDLRRIMHQVDPAAEWRQSYAEAGRIIRDYFWEPGMGGVDWPAILDQYRPLVERVATPDEFADLLREVLGELGTSHAYVGSARRDEGPAHYQRPIGLLGADFRRTKDGEWVVTNILPGESSDTKARSPLAGSGIREGAVLTHVDGRPVDPVAGPYALLTAAGGTTVELTFRPAEGSGPPRRAAVAPLIDERPLRYQYWVARRRALVRELSKGACGYLHIPDMGGSGWAQFNRDLRMEVSRPALIVDVRGNAGGYISELVIEKLTRVILGWDLTRNAEPVSYAGDAPRGPVVALTDEATSSDGDMITAAFRLQGIGPVVGTRTWGGVVGMTGRHWLGDGTVITVPMNAAWFDAYGWGVENYGVDPDIEVLRTPVDWAEGRCTVLEQGVRTALELLERHPAATPPDYRDVPDRRRPPLPPRPRPS